MIKYYRKSSECVSSLFSKFYIFKYFNVLLSFHSNEVARRDKLWGSFHWTIFKSVMVGLRNRAVM